MPIDRGEWNVRNDSGGVLVVRGYSWPAGVTLNLADPATTDTRIAFALWHQARAAWRDDGSWLGALRVAGSLTYVTDRKPDPMTWTE